MNNSNLTALESRRDLHPAWELAAALMINVIGPSTFNVLPLLATGATQTLGFSDAQVGGMSFAISVGSAAGALFSLFWVRTVKWPMAAAFALTGMSTAFGASMLVQNYLLFVTLQGLTGFFGLSGYCLAITILSDRSNAARSFGIAFATQTAYQAAILLAGPALLRAAGFRGVLGILTVCSGLAIFCAPLLPSGSRAAPASSKGKYLLSSATLLALLATAVFFVNAGAYWTYIDLMGLAQGFSSEFVANTTAFAVCAGILGAILAGALGDRVPRRWSIGVSTAITVVAVTFLHGAFGFAAFSASLILYYVAWNYALPYQLAVINAVDPSGRAVAIQGAFGYAGASAGASLAALAVTPRNYSAVISIVCGSVTVSALMFGLSWIIHTRRGA